MLVDLQSGLSLFSHFSYTSKHDSHGFLHAFFKMKDFLLDYKISKLLLDSAHDRMSYYQQCKCENITLFIDLNDKGGKPPVYKDDFTINSDSAPICKTGYRICRDGMEAAKSKTKFKCPKISRKNGCISYTCDNPCSDVKYGCIVYCSSGYE